MSEGKSAGYEKRQQEQGATACTQIRVQVVAFHTMKFIATYKFTNIL